MAIPLPSGLTVYYYIAIGDGGAANDVAPGHIEDRYPVNAGCIGQDIEANLFGNILRIDVSSGNPYGTPPDSPLVGKPVRTKYMLMVSANLSVFLSI